MIVTRPPFRQQPRGPTQIDRGNALGSKVITYLPLSGDVPYGTQSNAQKVTLGAGGSYVARSKGRSLKGSGSAAVASVPIDMSPYSQITIAAWLYWPTNGSADKFCFEYTPTVNTIGNKGFYWDPDNSLTASTFSIGSSNGAANGVGALRFPQPTAGAWHRILTTFDINIALPCTSAYVDGVAQTLGTDATATLTAATTYSNDTLHLFSRNETTLFGDGNLQDLVFYKGLLSAGEAKADYENPYQILLPRRIWVPSATQLLRPASVISAGSWLPSTGATLYGTVDETAADDADYDFTLGPSTMELKFGSGTDPGIDTGHIIRYRIRGVGQMTVSLMQGASTIKSWNHSPLSTFTTYEQTLTSGEASAITDYTDLRLKFVSAA